MSSQHAPPGPENAMPIQRTEWDWENVLHYLVDEAEHPTELHDDMGQHEFLEWLGEWTASFSDAEEYQDWFEEMVYNFREDYSTNIIGGDDDGYVTHIVYNPDNISAENYHFTRRVDNES